MAPEALHKTLICKGYRLKAIFHCSRLARAGDVNLVKNQSCGHAKKLNVVQFPSVSARTKADKKRSD